MVFLALLRDPALVHGPFHPAGEGVGRAMLTSILLLFFLPWLDTSPVRSGNYRSLFQALLVALVVDVLVLGWAGWGAPTPVRNAIGPTSAAITSYIFS